MLTTITYWVWQLDSNQWVPYIDCDPASLSDHFNPVPCTSENEAWEAGRQAADAAAGRYRGRGPAAVARGPRRPLDRS